MSGAIVVDVFSRGIVMLAAGTPPFEPGASKPDPIRLPHLQPLVNYQLIHAQTLYAYYALTYESSPRVSKISHLARTSAHSRVRSWQRSKLMQRRCGGLRSLDYKQHTTLPMLNGRESTPAC